MSLRKDHNPRANILAKSLPGGGKNKFILKNGNEVQWERINGGKWFVNILLVLDEFLHYFLFHFSISNILTQFHTTHEKIWSNFSQWCVLNWKFLTPSCVICKFARKLELLAKIFTLLASKFVYTSLSFFNCEP